MQHISWTHKIILKISVLWDVVPCCLVDTYNYFGGLAAPIFRVQEFFYPKEGCRKYSETWVHIYQTTWHHISEDSVTGITDLTK